MPPGPGRHSLVDPADRPIAAGSGRRWCRVVVGLLVTTVAACAADPTIGYSTRPAHDERIRTVAVPVFGNNTFSHGLEFHLTEAVIKEIRRSTPWRIAAVDTADATLRGTIVSAELRRLSLARGTGLVQEQAVELTVDFELVEQGSGQTLVSRRGFRVVEVFVPSRPSMERLELGQHAAIQQLARDIVAQLRSNW